MCPAGCVNTETQRTDDFQGSADGSEYSGWCGFPSSSSLLVFLCSSHLRVGQNMRPQEALLEPQDFTLRICTPPGVVLTCPPPGRTLGPKAMNFPALHSPSLFRLFLLSPPSLLCPLSRSVVSDSFRTPWTVARQAPLSMGFSRQEDWNGLTFPPPGDLPNPGIEPSSPALAGGFFITEPPGNHKPSLSALPYI